MTEVRYDHPLKLPPHWTPTLLNAREHSQQFPAHIDLDDALRFVEDEIRACGFIAPVIYTNSVALNNPRLRKVEPRQSGVAIQFGTGRSVVWLACDKWQTLEQNLYALHLTLRALRNIESWGIAPAEFMLQAMNHVEHATSHTTNAQNSSTSTGWMATLGLGPTADLEDANAVYRRRAKLVAENEDELLKLNQAMDEARKHLR